jgi:hypothetical protein
MFSPEMLQLVNGEKQKDLQRELDHRKVVQAALLQAGPQSMSYRKAAGWLGTQLVKWGAKLQSYDGAPLQTKFQ